MQGAARALGDRLGSWYKWAAAGACVGGIPVLAAEFLGWYPALGITALLLAPLLMAAAAGDRLDRGAVLLAAAFAGHSAVVLFFTARSPDAVAGLFPEGEAYWRQTRQWILTGENPEYESAYWLPVHLLLFLSVALLAYPSFGFLTLYVGLAQVDLMNVYVGHLLVSAPNPWLALMPGWHPWSILRGLGYLLVTFEVASLSLERLAAVPLSTPERRWGRWRLAFFFLAADVATKYCCLEPCRRVLLEQVAP
ncbi:MAG: hypothetical protein U0793_28625 [Gemmataceae bacterium]